MSNGIFHTTFVVPPLPHLRKQMCHVCVNKCATSFVSPKVPPLCYQLCLLCVTKYATFVPPNVPPLCTPGHIAAMDDVKKI